MAAAAEAVRKAHRGARNSSGSSSSSSSSSGGGDGGGGSGAGGGGGGGGGGGSGYSGDCRVGGSCAAERLCCNREGEGKGEKHAKKSQARAEGRRPAAARHSRRHHP